jgi:hypothetical protein
MQRARTLTGSHLDVDPDFYQRLKRHHRAEEAARRDSGGDDKALLSLVRKQRAALQQEQSQTLLKTIFGIGPVDWFYLRSCTQLPGVQAISCAPLVPVQHAHEAMAGSYLCVFECSQVTDSQLILHAGDQKHPRIAHDLSAVSLRHYVDGADLLLPLVHGAGHPGRDSIPLA